MRSFKVNILDQRIKRWIINRIHHITLVFSELSQIKSSAVDHLRVSFWLFPISPFILDNSWQRLSIIYRTFSSCFYKLSIWFFCFTHWRMQGLEQWIALRNMPIFQLIYEILHSYFNNLYNSTNFFSIDFDIFMGITLSYEQIKNFRLIVITY